MLPYGHSFNKQNFLLKISSMEPSCEKERHDDKHRGGILGSQSQSQGLFGFAPSISRYLAFLHIINVYCFKYRSNCLQHLQNVNKALLVIQNQVKQKSWCPFGDKGNRFFISRIRVPVSHSDHNL